MVKWEMSASHDVHEEGDRLCERYGKPLEAEHWGEYAMITRDGRIVVAPTLVDTFVQGSEVLGSGHFIFKVGVRATVTLRSTAGVSPARASHIYRCN